MKYGGSIFLIVVGAIIAFALNIDFAVVDRELIGFICLGAGVFGLVISVVIDFSAKRRVVQRKNTTEELQ